MKRSIPAIALFLGCASAVWAGPPATLTSLHAAHALTHAEAARELPVAFEATVTYRRAGETTLFVQDGNEGIYVSAGAENKLAAGDRVLVRGKTQDSFRPIVIAGKVVVLHHGSLPRPLPATFDQLVRSQLDCTFVSIRGVVQSADQVVSGQDLTTHIQFLADGGLIQVYLNESDPGIAEALLDAEVELSGVASAKFDGKMQKVGVAIAVPALNDVKILKRANASPWSLPVTPMDDILGGSHVKDLTQRVRVHGTITYYQPGSALVLQSGPRSLWVMTRYERPLRIGDQANVTGFPKNRDDFLVLTNAEIQETQVYDPISPLAATRSQLASSKYLYDLVSVEGQVVMEVRESSQDEYVLISDGQLFSAIYRHPSVSGMIPLPMNRIPLGSTARVVGICIPESSNPYHGDVPFDILMRSPQDVAVIGSPSLLNVRNLIVVVSLLLLIVIAGGYRSWFIERRVRLQTAAGAYIERRRSRILEDINGARPLAEIVEQITELVSFRLKGAPCWCQIAGGALLGHCPSKPAGMRIAHHQITARSGFPLGELFAAFDPLAKPSPIESEALASAAGLATLAIETRRLYSDLLHRSEFDLLTDIQNRFSMEKHLDSLIDEVRLTAGIFGLIYIDLDGFKQVNDRYGHHIGDLYLQEAASRMKRQLRPGDILARLGGDEFAALVPTVRSRSDVEEIALRLERCFDEHFTEEGYVLHGSASVGIALYPEDASTRDLLLHAADAAMYAAKNAKKSQGVMQILLPHAELTRESRK